MRKQIVLLISLILLILPLASQSEEMSSSKPTVYAVMMHADWCGACKALAPKIEQARENSDLDSKDVLFITLDLTDETSKNQAAMMASALGFQDLYNNNAGKTGFMVLVNAKTGEKITSITNKLDRNSISEKISDALASIPS